MEKVTKNARIADLESKLIVMQTQINSLIESGHSHTKRLIALEPDNPFHGKFYEPIEPKLKQLDQSVFDDEPEQIKWAVVTSEGAVLKFELEPVVKDGLWSWAHGNGCRQHALIGQYDTTNWQNSLIERDKVELTGSDLCRAMLERGDKFVMCGVSDGDDIEAANLEDDDFLAEAVTDFDDADGLFDAASMRWLYAVPINNQGEPLTAAEVGL